MLNLQLLSSGPGGGEKSVCDLQSMGWGGSCSGLDNNIWSRDPVLGSSATAFDLDQAFSFLEDVPIGRGEGGMESSVQMFEIPLIRFCLAAFISEIRRALSPEAFNCCLTQ